MKKIGLLMTLFMFVAQTSIAQENFKQSLSGIKQVRIQTNTTVKVIAGGSGDMEISKYKSKDDHDHDNYNYSYNYDESNKKSKEDKRKGMKAIYAGGVDNTGYGMSVERDGDILRIRDLKSWTQRGGLQFTIPKDVNVFVDCGSLGSVKVEGFTSEIEIDSNVGSVYLTDVTGPITAHSSTGLIEVKFSNVSQTSPISISSSTGDVDVSLPVNTKTDLELRSTMGTVYTDFDLEIPREDGMKRIGATRKIESQLNGGGVKISLRSSTGDVYLRKANN